MRTKHTLTLLALCGISTVTGIACSGSSSGAVGPSAATARASRSYSSADFLKDANETAKAQVAVLPSKTPLDWKAGTFYTGLGALAQSPDGAYATQALLDIGQKTKWTPFEDQKDPTHADNDTVGAAFLIAYEIKKDSAILAPTKARMDRLVSKITQAAPAQLGQPVVWTWCDALFMSPPVLARLAADTGDGKYLDALDAEWKRAADLMWDTKDHLFYRDKRFLTMHSPGDKKIFWSRGNGWVFAGLARTIDRMGVGDPRRDWYVDIYKKMADKLATLQQKDGTWPSSLVDPTAYQNSESTGTALDCFAFAWGVNNRILDGQTFMPVTTKAYAALLASRRADGLIGYAQNVGDRPGPAEANHTEWYANGAFIMAAVELAKMDHVELPPAPTLVEAPAKPTTTYVIPATQPGQTAYVRWVPERYDDIAWENDRVAFRIYGPELEHHEPGGSGMDVWCKSTRRLCVNDWYKTADYHKDHGEGVDAYEVGRSRGCGGIGIWQNNKLLVGKGWREYKILQNGLDVAKFEVTYAPIDIGNGHTVTDTRIITLHGGSNLNTIESTLSQNFANKDQVQYTVAIGLAKHKDGEITHDVAKGLMMEWESADAGYGKQGTGILVDPKLITATAEDDQNYFLLIKATAGEKFTYRAGGCWERGLDFKTRDDWEKYLRAQ